MVCYWLEKTWKYYIFLKISTWHLSVFVNRSVTLWNQTHTPGVCVYRINTSQVCSRGGCTQRSKSVGVRMLSYFFSMFCTLQDSRRKSSQPGVRGCWTWWASGPRGILLSQTGRCKAAAVLGPEVQPAVSASMYSWGWVCMHAWSATDEQRGQCFCHNPCKRHLNTLRTCTHLNDMESRQCSSPADQD